MTERQQNRNICVVGKAKDGMTIDTSKIKIEDVSERVISIDDSFNTEDDLDPPSPDSFCILS